MASERYTYECRGCQVGPCKYSCPDRDQLTTVSGVELPPDCVWGFKEVNWKLNRRPRL